VPLALLQHEGGWLGVFEGCETGERVRPCAIREVVKAASADIRHIDTEVHCVLSASVAGDIAAVEMVLGAAEVSLRPTSGERT